MCASSRAGYARTWGRATGISDGLAAQNDLLRPIKWVCSLSQSQIQRRYVWLLPFTHTGQWLANFMWSRAIRLPQEIGERGISVENWIDDRSRLRGETCRSKDCWSWFPARTEIEGHGWEHDPGVKFASHPFGGFGSASVRQGISSSRHQYGRKRSLARLWFYLLPRAIKIRSNAWSQSYSIRNGELTAECIPCDPSAYQGVSTIIVVSMLGALCDHLVEKKIIVYPDTTVHIPG